MLAGAENPAPIPPNEIARLQALDEYAAFDTPPDDDLDRLVDLAARMFDMPIAALSLVGHDRLYFKSRHGTDATGIGRDGSFCSCAIFQDDLFLVPDVSKDERFSSHPLVTQPPKIRFYAGVPLVAPSGQKIGTLCVLDDKPWGGFSEDDRKNLEDVAALVMNRMEMRRLNHAQKIGQSRFQSIAAISPDAITCANSKGNITFWNEASERLFGFTTDEISGQPLGTIFPDHLRNSQTLEIARFADSGAGHVTGAKLGLVAMDAHGEAFPVVASLSMWREGKDPSFGLILRDITEEGEGEKRLFGLAHVDALTGLPDRSLLCSELQKGIETRSGAVFAVDTDKLKDINDTLGHSVGDLLLRSAVDRLRTHIGTEGTLARLAGDEFAVFLPGVSEPSQAADVAADIAHAFVTPFVLDGQQIHVSVSIGIALCPTDGADPDELLANADLALHRAKADGGNRYKFFVPGLRQAAVARRACEAELRRALAQGEFELYYQPQVKLADSRIVGAEALLRWRHPSRGLLAPRAFLSVLETGTLAAAVGDWVLKTACANAADWRRLGLPTFRIGVNLFEAQFRSGDLASTVETALADSGLPAELLELEITENIVLRHDEAIINPLRQVRDVGVGVAFDDYGTGYASLSLLKRFPLTRLKIDQAFVCNVCDDDEDAAIIQAIMYLGRRFGLSIIAEGIETEAQETALRMVGCTEGQGYLYSRPLPAHAFTSLLLQGRARTVA